MGKSPGPDGWSRLYYKCFHDQLLLPLKNVTDSIMQGSAVPDAWKKKNIVLLQKEGHNLTSSKSYRLIPLLNNDYKNIYTTSSDWF